MRISFIELKCFLDFTFNTKDNQIYFSKKGFVCSTKDKLALLQRDGEKEWIYVNWSGKRRINNKEAIK